MRAAKTKFFALVAAGTLAAALGALVGGQDAALGQAGTAGTWTYFWNAPGTGGPVAYYRVQYVVNGRDTTVIERVSGNSVNIAVELGSDYQVRVRGVNASGAGPWSAWSFMQTYEEQPPTNTSGSGTTQPD